MDSGNRAEHRKPQRGWADRKANPLKMRQLKIGELDESGPWVLSETMCSVRRVEFLTRANSILGFYYVIAGTSETGFNATEAFAKEKKFKASTAIRLGMGGTSITVNYGKFRKVWQTTQSYLTNQVFLMVYGNFEAYLADLVMDGLKEIEPDGDTHDDALDLLVGRKWEGKIASVDHRLSIGLKGTLLRDWFKDVAMEFLGTKCSQPMDFLEKVSDLRDRVVHYGSRVDTRLADEYPDAGLKVGEDIRFPFEMPLQFNFFLAHLSDLVDEAFCQRFGWARSPVRPETLV